MFGGENNTITKKFEYFTQNLCGSWDPLVLLGAVLPGTVGVSF